ncbi:glycosyltransferase family 4 protein [Methanocella sp. MCL-LM]|uniref:glycosyltransferase family 4 protein n=1 Tax=Methanocella sp. MCL-LM TaxID=3412035 RepID=UPI003C76B357
MKIVMIRSTDLYTNRLHKSALALTKNGHDVKILEWDRDCKLSKDETKNGYNIHRLRFKATYGVKNVIFLPFFWIYEFFWLLNEKFDAVHAADFDTYFVSLIVCKLKRKPIIYDIFDFYADMLQPSIISDSIAVADKFLMKFANCVIIADESRIDQIGKGSNKNVVVITNSPNDLVKSTYNGESVNKNFIIFFAATLQKDRFLNLDTMINAISGLDDVKLFIVGDGDEKDHLIELSKNNTNIKFFGYKPYHEVLSMTGESHLLFSLYDPCNKNNRFASPNKLFEAMMFSKPILVSDNTSMALIVKKYNCGVVVNCRNADEIRSVILRLKNNLDLCNELGNNGRKAYVNQFSWEIMEDRLLSIYKNL